jgi:hypothetical protein
MLGAESAGHRDADDFVMTERVDRERGGERGIDPAAEPEDDGLKPHFST